MKAPIVIAVSRSPDTVRLRRREQRLKDARQQRCNRPCRWLNALVNPRRRASLDSIHNGGGRRYPAITATPAPWSLLQMEHDNLSAAANECLKSDLGTNADPAPPDAECIRAQMEFAARLTLINILYVHSSPCRELKD